METNRIVEILKSAYHWGCDYGSNRSDKNFSDFLETSQAKEIFAQEPQITDEEIEKAAKEHPLFLGYGGKYNVNIAKEVSFIQGARAVRDNLI